KGKRLTQSESDQKDTQITHKFESKWVGVGAAERAESAALCGNLIALLGLSTKERELLKQPFKFFSVGNALRKNL
ncbi:hypothetical protein P3675_24100, partial [Vibrio parahaemolyticus]|nr:hypothetical protein [Vibrio parahaemolyticus]